ncbi:hypothetical protein [Pseudosulfitobacter sp. DSM 107133]|uniref:hypothetical protein n=1 Tax=Pseudosulfitobacter sp. DSM 107133 TaxID=2883100 RepID=UPI000DF27267|nr:hypothetical protein [Pseudosulfitobacter sp. DSM 107133]UOA25940.1 hypothetical protein DSM107133_00629 [Pseudosulfitobacter sp. DSM 107133]
MLSLRLFAWAAFAVAALCIVVAIAAEALILISPAIAALISGVLFLAADRAIFLLTEIKDALKGTQPAIEPSLDTTPSAARETRSIEEISRDIENLKTRAAT